MDSEPIKALISELRESEPTKEEVIDIMEFFLRELAKTYSKGFEDCISELEKIDAKSKKPSHLK